MIQRAQDCLSVDHAALPADGAPFERAQPVPESRFLLRGRTERADPPAMIRSAFRKDAPPRGSTIDDDKSGGAGLRVAREPE